MKKNKHVIIPIFVSHEGCPNDCVFCNQKKITGFEKAIDTKALKDYIESYIKTINLEISKVEIAFYGGSFTGINESVQNQYLEVAYEFVKKGLVEGLRLSTRPDYIDQVTLMRLKQYGVKTIELGIQSMSHKVLQLSKRNYDVTVVYEAVRLIKKHQIELGLQMMTGLPGDTGSESIETAKILAKLEPKFVRIYPTLIIKNTHLEELFLQNMYSPLSLEETVDLVATIYEIFHSKSINVIRIGLQPTENMTLGRDIIAGPFHPSIRSLVISRFILNQMLNEINEETHTLIIQCHPKDISYVVGNKKSNVTTLENMGINIQIVQSGDIKREKIIIRSE